MSEQQQVKTPEGWEPTRAVDSVAVNPERLRKLERVAAAATVGRLSGLGVGHYERGSVHWYDPLSTPMLGCPLCAALADLDGTE